MWNWLKSAFSFISSLTGKILGKSGERALVNSTCDDAIAAVENITERLIADQIGVDTWLRECRLALKNAYIQQYLLGIGGKWQLTQKDYGSIGGMLSEQYKYLQNFAREIAAGNLTPGQIRMRISMYANSAREGYGRGRARAHGIPEGKLPAYPGIGSECLCITTPESRVLTDTGWKPLYDIIPGDFVATHLGNFKRVISTFIKDAEGEEEYLVKAPNEETIGCTGNHLWHTTAGWINTKGIYNNQLSMYNKNKSCYTETKDVDEMQNMRKDNGEQKQNRYMQVMSFNLSLRELERLQGEGMYFLRNEQESKRAMENKQGIHSAWNHKSGDEKKDKLRRFRKIEMATGIEREVLELLLEAGSEKENCCSKISLGLDNGKREDTSGHGDTPHQRGLHRRQAGEFAIDDEIRTRSFACNVAEGLDEKIFSRETYTELDMPSMRKDVRNVPSIPGRDKKILLCNVSQFVQKTERFGIYLSKLRQDIRKRYALRKRTPKILFSRMLCGKSSVNEEKEYLSLLRRGIYPRSSREKQVLFAGMLESGAKVYDITVEDDASFVIEGLISHNTNCRCFWDIVDRKDRYDCYWLMSAVRTEHCPVCLERSRKWNPYVIEKE